MKVNRNRRGGKPVNRIQSVSIVDKDESPAGARLDRQIKKLAESQGDIMVLINSAFSLDSTASDTVSRYSFQQVVAADEFVSLSAQFQKFRVAGIRFDVYDINTPSVVNAFFGTYHDANVTTPPVLTQQSIIDAPDSLVIPPGTGKASLYWTPSGTDEYDFQSTGNYFDFGGMGAFLSGVTTPAIKFRVVMKAVVHFRGRI